MLDINHLSLSYSVDEKPLTIIDDLTLSIEKNKFIVFLGPSGCGKTSFLKLLAGLIKPTSGEIVLNGKKIEGPSKERGVVFQHFSLYPWLTVRKNIAFGLELKKIDQAKQNEIVNHYLTIINLKQYADFYPNHLSGGMQQRVAIGRMLANNPEILLMDEPFGSLDSQTREQMQDFLIKMYEKEKKTIIFITHDVVEAMLLADTIYVMSAKPMHIKRSFDMPFPRPRTHQLKYTNEFFELEKMIAKELE